MSKKQLNNFEQLYTGWKGNKWHPFNSRRRRLKGPKFKDNMGSTFDSFLRKRCFLFCFVHVVRDFAKKIYISRFILQGRNIIFKNILRVRCNLRKINWHFMRIFWSERCGNAVKKAKWSLRLRNLKVDALTVQRRARCLSLLPFVRSYKLK